jgi:hypothetical protein
MLHGAQQEEQQEPAQQEKAEEAILLVKSLQAVERVLNLSSPAGRPKR